MDRIERNVGETKNNLDRGDRIIDGVSSVGGHLKNLVTPDMYKNKYGAYEAKDRTVCNLFIFFFSNIINFFDY